MPFPVEERRIVAAEEALGRRLPDGLRARLREENGGEIEAGGILWHLATVFDDSDRARLRRTATSHVVHETERLRDAFGEDMPQDAIVVANDGSGNHLVLLPGEDEPRWWELRTGELEPAPTDWSQASADAVERD